MSQILIVDDVPQNLKALSLILESRGYAVHTVDNGHRALQAAGSSPPDLILLDIMMPDIDGYEVCRRLKTDPALASIPIIFVSALDETLDKVRAFEVGGVDYIAKPFHPEEILARVETQMELRRLQTRLIEQVEAQEKVNKQLSEANVRLGNLLKDKEDLQGILAHDLGNILALMTLKLDILIKRYDSLSPEKIAHHLVALKKTKDQMASIIARLLDVAQIDDKPIKVNWQPSLPGMIINQVLDQYAGLASEKRITLNYEQAGDDEPIRTDPTLLGEVFSNLISNAIKYSPTDTAVAVRLTRNSQSVTIEVEDNGPGLSESDRAKLFTKFARLSAKPTGGEKSLGLGLYIARKLTQAIGGTITADSPGADQGSTFTICLPIGKNEPM
ncbi:MAG: hybrid sensor histidine kinase/response regulator [Anaerolineae bacterium]|nr:hybrid sensor histidine kinase/response regulator [Anaerolineae bacterium]